MRLLSDAIRGPLLENAPCTMAQHYCASWHLVEKKVKKGEKKVKKKDFRNKKKIEVGQLEVSNQRHSASEPILRRPARFVRS